MATSNESSSSPPDIKPGGVNKERTHCRCVCCHKVMPFDPSFNEETACPHCEEHIFGWACELCQPSISRHGDITEEPAFADIGCSGCGNTQAQIEEDERQEEEFSRRMERFDAEKDRVKHAAEFRQQRGYRQTSSPEWSKALMRCNELSEAQSLRLMDSDWKLIRPYVARELSARGVALTTDWCINHLSYFLRVWQDEHIDALKCGAMQDLSGSQQHFLFSRRASLKVRLREIREGYSECHGVWPTAPAVHVKYVNEDNVEVTWDSPNVGNDPREIYRHDVGVKLTLFEFLIWSARVGGVGGDEFNEDYEADEPEAYVPSEWCGRPVAWEMERQSGFRRWFWMREQESMGESIEEWARNFGQRGRQEPAPVSNDMIAKSRANMRVCHVCFRKPDDGELILCECAQVLYCSKACQEEHWEVHKFEPTARHENVTRICLQCGKEGTNLARCSRCTNCYFCDRTCQTNAWKKHKKECVSS